MDKVNFESGAVQSYLGILQGVINRMASNSAGCKTWCITLVSATGYFAQSFDFIYKVIIGAIIADYLR